MSLKQAAASGTRWFGTAASFAAALQILQTVVLARLLVPTDFGLIAMVLVVLGFAQVCADMGFSNAIIHRRVVTREELSSLYWPTLLVGVVLYLAVIALNPVLWPLFGEPRLQQLMPIAALEFLILPWGMQFRVLLEKNLRFRELAIIETTAALIGASVAIATAIAGVGVFALIYGQLSNSAVRTVLLCRIGWRDWRPYLHFGLRDLNGYLRFGLYQMGERMLGYLHHRLDHVLIGMLLGAQELGYYSIAYNLAAVPIARINPVLTRVAFPIFARVQDDTEQLKYGYMTVRRVVAAISFPILFGIIATAPVFVPLVLGDQWLPSIVLIQVLSLVALGRAVGNPIGSLLLAAGRPDLGFYFVCFAVAFQVPVVYLGAQLGGAVGVSLALVVTVLVFMSAEYLFLVRRLVGPSLLPYLESLLPATCTASLMAVAVLGLAQLRAIDGYLLLLVQIAVGVVLYVSLNWLLFRQSTHSILRLARGRDA